MGLSAFLAQVHLPEIIDNLTSPAPSNLVDVLTRVKEAFSAQVCTAVVAAVSILPALMYCPTTLAAQEAAAVAGMAGPPPSSVGAFPLAEVKRGMKGTAWTVFEGTVPEPMEVEILGVLRGARGPGRDLILARLHGTKPEYTGVVAGMSGSPVYLQGKLLGALSYRIGQFSKEPIAGITPIEQMLEVRDLPTLGGSVMTAGSMPDRDSKSAASLPSAGEAGMTFSAMETPLLMSGFAPEAIKVWQERVAGTGLEMVSAGGAMAGMGSSSAAEGPESGPVIPMMPGSAVSLQMVRGDLEIAATCTVTYVDPKQLLACGHPVLQAGTVSLPMTSTEVVATLASPLNAFKIVNTGRTIGAFTEDRDAAIRGELGAKARMIPVSLEVVGGGKPFSRKIEVLDLPSLTSSALLVSVYQTLLETNQSTAKTSYHVTGEIAVHGQGPVPIDAWGTPGDSMAAQLAAALAVGDSFNRLYASATRSEPMESVRLRVDVISEDRRTELEGVRLVSSSIVHAGERVVVEATLHPWKQAVRNVRLGFDLPARLQPGNVRLLVGSATSLDRTLEGARPAGRPVNLAAASSRLRGLHAADKVYVSLLLPESQASLEGSTLDSLPLTMANTMESQRSGAEVGLHGESLVVAAEADAGGVLSGQQLLTLRVEAGGGLH